MSLRSIIKSFSSERWNIGFIQNDIDSILNGAPLTVEWVKHNYKKSWFADPFILEVTDDEIHVLVEEFYKPIERGRISRLIVDKNSYELKHKDVVLELPTHLSFPVILRNGNDIFIYPENGESGELNIYHYLPNSNKCIKLDKLLDASVADAIITVIDGREMLFCTKQPNPNGNLLSVYLRDKTGQFVESDCYSFDENVARMAGDFFEFKGRMYRPTQECNVQYGHAVTIQEMMQVNGKFQFKEIRRLYSVHPKLTVGMHTFNMYKGHIVTDALGFDNMWIRKALKMFGKK